MDLSQAVEDGRGDALHLERLYRQSRADGRGEDFGEAVALLHKAHPGDQLVRAWALRLELEALPDPPGVKLGGGDAGPWRLIAFGAGCLAIVFALLSWGGPPVPIPGEAHPAFWIGWAPAAAMAILALGAAVDRGRMRRYGAAGGVVALCGLVALVLGWGRSDQGAVLMTLHLPLVVWGAVGFAVVGGRENVQGQAYAFMVKSAETLLAAGIFCGAGMLLFGLSIGIFGVLGVRPPDGLGRLAGAMGLGAVPLMALGSAFDLRRPPLGQNWEQGMARLLKIVARAVLPLALTVLAVYVLYFVPAYFWRPFEERQVLIVYNATIMGVLLMVVCVTAGAGREDWGPVRWAVAAVLALTLLLNVYAGAAVLYRIAEMGLTPNRHAVLGWNLVTLFMLIILGDGLRRSWGGDWAGGLRRRGLFLLGPAWGWGVWVGFAVGPLGL